MGSITYRETFEVGAGGWIAWLGPGQPAPAVIEEEALVTRSPWGIDSNHAPPGGGYLHLLFILYTAHQDSPGDSYAPLLGGNRFIDGGYPRDFRNARLTLRLKGNVDLQGAELRLHCQSRVGDKAINFVLTSQSFEVTPEWSEQTITLTPDPEQWLCLGARHDLHEVYDWGDIDSVLRDVNIDIILLLHPLKIVPLSPQQGGPHARRAEVDYEVDRGYLPTGEIRLGEVQIDFDVSSAESNCR
ncbi:MAG: hypothetical protein F4047_05150 [Caldilineaceae bacterium SB0670_bin_27]|uniref:Uncharacterized protein n=1 Tax=Caldilineaceae bacterium SB0664_bin_27 TaxID=2605260 RepID=A0A6B0YQ53_9CHLR|nr:hypothetical protein [Caldilineaceae bacterium SB0664_bin_27]MYJ77540.1 hypothetical protein [Caldilineaceae bacterium SB0670_bin_27]